MLRDAWRQALAGTCPDSKLRALRSERPALYPQVPVIFASSPVWLSCSPTCPFQDLPESAWATLPVSHQSPSGPSKSTDWPGMVCRETTKVRGGREMHTSHPSQGPFPTWPGYFFIHSQRNTFGRSQNPTLGQPLVSQTPGVQKHKWIHTCPSQWPPGQGSGERME